MHHNPARMVRERRQSPGAATPSAVVDVNPSAAATSEVNLTVPTSTTALAVVVSILAVVILLGVGICVFRRRRNAKKNSAPSNIIDFTDEKTRSYGVDSKLDLHASAYGLEKPSPAFMPGASAADMNPNWVPQINRGADLASSSTSSSKKSKKSKKSLRASRGWDKTFSKFAPSERSPPPSYMVANGNKTASIASQIPLPPSPPHHSEIPPTPPTPPAKKALNPFSRDIPSAKPVPSELPPPMPLPSPARSASFAAHQSASFSHMDKVDEESMPRLMNVVNSFNPSMDDELLIQIGETVRVLEEYQDGWALVQRIGRIDAPKGVVPRTCIAERERVIPVYNPGRRL
ncbi:hypothetical protein C8F04DRAFT_42678 [Mycena alexandri]|uniref:SH3 domain-containing protein n=1 Tax=Mycena alexandri TaxID=1745969 RepID=A0AAD6SN83_9AGAR|nr:hypothetical protein C8F04DRAFT_42678 [Mycena alexandri]